MCVVDLQDRTVRKDPLAQTDPTDTQVQVDWLEQEGPKVHREESDWQVQMV
jgi:hypothetical protein